MLGPPEKTFFGGCFPQQVTPCCLPPGKCHIHETYSTYQHIVVYRYVDEDQGRPRKTFPPDLLAIVLALHGSEIASADAHRREASRVQTVQEVFRTGGSFVEIF